MNLVNIYVKVGVDALKTVENRFKVKRLDLTQKN